MVSACWALAVTDGLAAEWRISGHSTDMTHSCDVRTYWADARWVIGCDTASIFEYDGWTAVDAACERVECYGVLPMSISIGLVGG